MRPPDTSHKHPILVFDSGDNLHMPLTIFAKEAAACLTDKTAHTYIHAILPFFTYLEQDEWQMAAGRRWDGKPAEVQQAVDDYLVQKLGCKVREHRLGFQTVSMTAGARSTIRVFLSGLKLFYRVVQARELYPGPNPLADGLSIALAEVEAGLDDGLRSPNMPEWSGVSDVRPRRRLTDSYFKVEGQEWIPQVVDDPTLPARVLVGGRTLKRWGLREECVTRILFESGGRVSEVTGLTLGEWIARGALREASAFSKGSNGRRVKFLRFSEETAKLLRRYCDEDRRRLDSHRYSVKDYMELNRLKQVNLLTVPLFLSAQKTAFTAKTYREYYWNPACDAARISADVHQCRHWYVTMAVRQIYETATTEGEVKRRLRELIEYMKWRQGWQTIEAYEHYFDAVRHAEVQDLVHARLDEALKQGLTERQHRRPTLATAGGLAPERTQQRSEDDDDFEFLRRIGGGSVGT